jgi:hypothetical protein
MKKIALILALAFLLSSGMALTTSFAFGLLPLLSADDCAIATDRQLNFATVLPSHFHRRIAA